MSPPPWLTPQPGGPSARNPKAPKPIRLVTATDEQVRQLTRPRTPLVLIEANLAVIRLGSDQRPDELAGAYQPGQPASSGLQTGAYLEVLCVEVVGETTSVGYEEEVGF